MKKFYFLMASCILCASLVAQNLSPRHTVAPENAQKMMPLAKSFDRALTFKSITPALKSTKATNDLLSSYYGQGVDKSGNTLNWSVLFGNTAEGAPVVQNPLLLMDGYNFAVTYEITETGITIPAQGLASLDEAGTQIITIASLAEDGAYAPVVFTLDEEGNLILSSEDTGFWVYDSTSGTNLGYYVYYNSAGWYVEEPKAATCSAAVVPEDLILHAHYSPSAYGYSNNLGIMPVSNNVVFKGYTTGNIVSNTWSYALNDEFVSVQSKDLTLATGPSQIYENITLTVADAESEASYVYGVAKSMMGGSSAFTSGYYSAESFEMSDGTYSLMTAANPDMDVAYYSSLGTPEVNSSGLSLSGLAFYQGKPSAPLYFEGIELYLYPKGFAVTNPDAEWTCNIRKATRNADGTFTMGDVIASSVLKAGDIITDYYFPVAAFTNFTIDDEGWATEVEYLQITEEFAIEITGWDAAGVSASPYGEYDEVTTNNRYIAYHISGDEAGYKFPSWCSRMLVGFTAATYGYLYTENATSFYLPKEGGSQSLIIEPYLCDVEEDEATGEANRTTSLYFADEYYELPDWLELTIPEERYDTAMWAFQLDVTAAALPADVTGRKETITLQQPGAELVLEVMQGDATSGLTQTEINARIYRAYANGDNMMISCPNEVKEVSIYNAAGQLINTVEVKNGKAVVTNAPKGLNVVNFGGKAVKVMM